MALRELPLVGSYLNVNASVDFQMKDSLGRVSTFKAGDGYQFDLRNETEVWITEDAGVVWYLSEIPYQKKNLSGAVVPKRFTGTFIPAIDSTPPLTLTIQSLSLKAGQLFKLHLRAEFVAQGSGGSSMGVIFRMVPTVQQLLTRVNTVNLSAAESNRVFACGSQNMDITVPLSDTVPKGYLIVIHGYSRFDLVANIQLFCPEPGFAYDYLIDSLQVY